MIGVSPDHLELDLAQSGASSQNIFLKNLDTKPVEISIEAERYAHHLEIEAAALILPSAGERAVKITARAGKNFSTNLEVVAHENSEIAAGIKIPLTVTGNKFITQYQYGFILLGAFLITFLAYAINKKRKK